MSKKKAQKIVKGLITSKAMKDLVEAHSYRPKSLYLTSNLHRRYGWVRDLPDHRDHQFHAHRYVDLTALPTLVDLRPKCPAVYDQGTLGSCTGNAIAGHMEVNQSLQGIAKTVTPSRMFIYFNERSIEGTVPYDAGAQIRNGIKTVVKNGACPETSWPYDITKFAVQPTTKCYVEALKHQALEYERVPQEITRLCGCLAAGFPFVLGFTVYPSFETAEVARTGNMVMPRLIEQSLGGHAVLAVGYNMPRKVFIVRNSWGASWGDRGYFYMPFDYMINPNLSSDFWTIHKIET